MCVCNDAKDNKGREGELQREPVRYFSLKIFNLLKTHPGHARGWVEGFTHVGSRELSSI